MQAQIDANKARLAALESEAREAEVGLDDLGRQIRATATRLDVLLAEIAQSAGSPSRCLERGTTPQLDGLCRQRDSIVTAHNALVERHNGLVERRRVLAEEHRRTLGITNELIDALNWTR